MRCSKNAAFKMTDAWRDQPHVRRRGQGSHRRGNIIVLGAAMMVMLLAMVAFAVDVGVIVHARTELLRSADACAMAAIMYLPDETAALAAAQELAAQNPSGGTANLSISDVEFGHWDRDGGHFLTTTTSAHGVNSVRVTVRRTQDSGNPVALFFAVLLGRNTVDVTATATTMYDNDLCGPLIGIDWVSVLGTPNTDSFDSDKGSYSPKTAGDRAGLCSDGPINIDGTAVVRGSARAGMGFNVTITGNSVVTGSIGSRLRPLSLPLVDASEAAALNDNNSLPLIPQGNSAVSPLDADGNFLLDGHKTYTMPPGTYYFNDFTVEGQSKLNITGETIIYVTGNLRRAGGTTVNNNTQIANNLQFLMTGGIADITSNNEFYGVIYAPNTDVTLDGSADLFGGVVGKTLTMTGGGQAHYDEALSVEGVDLPRERPWWIDANLDGLPGRRKGVRQPGRRSYERVEKTPHHSVRFTQAKIHRFDKTLGRTIPLDEGCPLFAPWTEPARATLPAGILSRFRRSTQLIEGIPMQYLPLRCNRRRARRGLRRRLGATITEFTIVAPIFFLLVLGSFEFGRAIMVQQILTNAAREGARQAIVEDAVAADVEASVTSYLDSTTVAGVTVTVDPSSLQTVGFGDEVTVTVSVPYDQVSWLPVSSFMQGRTLTGESMMRGERLQ